MPAQRQSGRSRLEMMLKAPAVIKTFVDTKIRPHLEPISFITLHYIYFCGTCFIASLIFWGSSTPARSVRYIDSFFLAVSAMTEAGLNTVNLSTLNTWQQIILFFLIILGSAIFVSIVVLHVRKSAFERRLEELAERKRRRLGLRTLTFSMSKRHGNLGNQREEAIASGIARGHPIQDPDPEEEYHPTFATRTRTESMNHVLTPDGIQNGNADPEHGQDPPSAHIAFGATPHPLRQTISNLQPLQRRKTFLRNSGVAAHSMAHHPRNAQPVFHEIDEELEEGARPRSGSLAKFNKYIDEFNGFVGRNSQFHHLSERERRALGGMEYDAICVLHWVVPLYFVLFQLFGAIGLGAWLQINRPNVALANGLSPFWTGAFFAVSAFNNSGMALLDANAAALQASYYSLLTLSLLILSGNTCFPVFLRLVLWALRKCIRKSWSPAWQKWRNVLTFILDHPRRVYTNLFPSTQTWWLAFTLVLFNGIDWLAFEVLNFGNPVVENIAPGYRAMAGLFQAFAVRSGGFYVVSISGLYPGLLVLYVLMMYISAFPVTMTIRNTNVYEERSLGIFADEQNEEPMEPEMKPAPSRGRNLFDGLKKTMTMSHGASRPARAQTSKTVSNWSNQDFLRTQLRGQLGHDLWWIALAVFLITIIETSQFHRDPVVFSVFNVIFEVVSAYGCVGISVGVPLNAHSFCGAWHTGSKLVLCAVMLRGRHRGLPVAIDRAILLPSATLGWAEEEDAHRRGISRGRRGTVVDNEGSRERRGSAVSREKPKERQDSQINGTGHEKKDGDLAEMV